jgi:hypothetical protein
MRKAGRLNGHESFDLVLDVCGGCVGATAFGKPDPACAGDADAASHHVVSARWA